MNNDVWVVLQQSEGKLHRMSREMLAAGQALASQLGGEVHAVLLGHQIGPLAAELAGRTALASFQLGDHADLADYTPGGYTAALSAILSPASPALVIFPHTYQSMDYFPRLAQAMSAAIVPSVLAVRLVDGELRFTRPILGGKLHAEVRVTGGTTAMVSLQGGVYSADDLSSGSCAVTAAELPAALPRGREILAIEQAGADQVDLSKADIIVAAGRGVGAADKLKVVEDLAAVLGAEIGASRPVIDNGWLPRDRQIGSSGQTVAPKLYIAAGISGAIQHLVGMKGASCIVAINKDASAPIFSVARYGIVGDLHEVLPALTEEIRAVKGS